MLEAKVLNKQGKTQVEIAQTFGVTVRTVHNWLRRVENNDLDRPDGRSHRKTKLRPFMDQVQLAVEDEPHLNCEVLFASLVKQGYDGQISRLRDEVAKIRKQVTRRIAFTFETTPAKQAQVDWKECGRFRFADGGIRKVYAFVMQMGYSRRAFIRLVTRMDSSTLLACHMAAFKYFGGVPAEILYDNMKTAFLYKENRWICNPRLRAFAAECGFRPKRCKTYCPWTKGKVERFNGFISKNLLPRLERQGIDLEETNDKVLEWLSCVADTRILRKFGQCRAERFAAEAPLLQPVPVNVDCSEVTHLRVHNDSTIVCRGVRYSVPPKLIGEQVELHIDPLGKDAHLYHAGKIERKITLEPEGSSCREVMLKEDLSERHQAWLSQETKRKERQARSRQAKQLEEDLVTRSPAMYDSLVEEAA